jgi:hypothetical protein
LDRTSFQAGETKLKMSSAGDGAVVGDYQDIKDGALSGRQEEVEDIPF